MSTEVESRRLSWTKVVEDETMTVHNNSSMDEDGISGVTPSDVGEFVPGRVRRADSNDSNASLESDADDGVEARVITPRWRQRSKSLRPEVCDELRAEDVSDITNLCSRFKVSRLMGSGQFGKVVEAQPGCIDTKVSVKVVKKASLSQQAAARLKREMDLLQDLAHPNVMPLYDQGEDEEAAVIVSRCLTGGDVFTAIATSGHLPGHKAKVIAKNLLQALAYCHGRGIVHRDLKMENVCFNSADTSEVTLVDFGLAERIPMNADGEVSPENKLREVCGSMNYLAPEMLMCIPKPDSDGYAFEVDMWAFGNILYAVCCGSLPFHESDPYRHLQRVLGCVYDFEPAEIWDREEYAHAKDLISKILVRNPEDRLTAKEALKHAWFQT
eukprot:GFYU01000896.1.p1 GENE.GFYU01000896.1~~GFYU01000896.1.p1  ORF type:complete len:384 (-),score=56.05 GFYU01000896.1:65-1216(-)